MVEIVVSDSILSDNTTGLESYAGKLTINNCSVFGNHGQGVYNRSGSTQLTVSRCMVNGNSGVGLSCEGSNLNIANNIIFGNSGTGIYTSGVYVKIINNLIYKNGTSNSGYGIHYSAGSPMQIFNNTIVSNASYGICNGSSTQPVISSNIIWDNGDGVDDSLSGYFTDVVNYNCIQGGWSTGTGNTSQPPSFRNTDANDFHLTSASTYCIDLGNPSTSGDNETDLDGESRKIGSAVDMGADEYGRSAADFNNDGIVDFLDFTKLAGVWKTNNATYNLADGATIDNKDLAVLCEAWLWIADSIGGEGAYFAENECPLGTYSEEDPNNQQDPNNPPPPGTPYIYLVYDGNMTPDPNTEITVYVHTDIPLFAMATGITITGDANITAAMDANDCNQFGWDPEWSTDPYIDPNGFIAYINGAAWDTVDANTNIGYFTFIYHSGPVNIAITADSFACDANDQPVTFSADSITLGGQMMMMSMQSQSSSFSPQTCAAGYLAAGFTGGSSESIEYVEPFDVNETLNWLDNLWQTDETIRESMSKTDWQEFLDAVKNSE
jgi:hypothetical protein